MRAQTFDYSDRLISVMYPGNFKEYQDALAAGYQVATTPQQRLDWGLKAFDDLAVLKPEEAIAVLFAEPGDAALAQYDLELADNPDNYDDEGNFVGIDADLDDNDEIRVETELTVSQRALAAGRQRQPVGSEDQ